LQVERYQRAGVRCNAEMTPSLIEECCSLNADCKALLRLAISDLNLSARAYHRILRVSRTIADLDSSAQIQPRHLTEAIQYRTLDRQLW